MNASPQEQEELIQEFYHHIADLRPIEEQLRGSDKPKTIWQEAVYVLAEDLIGNADKLHGNISNPLVTEIIMKAVSRAHRYIKSNGESENLTPSSLTETVRRQLVDSATVRVTNADPALSNAAKMRKQLRENNAIALGRIDVFHMLKVCSRAIPLLANELYPPPSPLPAMLA